MVPRPSDNPYTRRVRRLARLRQILALALLAAALGVLAVYLFNRWTERRALAANPAPAIAHLGLQVQQSASGVVITKSRDGRPAFRVYADHADKLRADGWDELYNVRILVYDQDGVYADEISGSAFGYNETSGELHADGLVHIDLHARPNAGTTGGGANPIHIDARALTFNVKAGTGRIDQPLAFSFRNAQGTAGRAVIDSHAGNLVLDDGVQATLRQPGQSDLRIASLEARLQRLAPSHPGIGQVLDNVPAEDPNADAVLLTLLHHAALASGTRSLSAEEMVFHLRRDQSLRHVDAWGDVRAAQVAAGRAVRATAAIAQADFVPAGAHHAALAGLRLQGGVNIAESLPRQQDRLTAAEAVFRFDAGHQLSLVQAHGAASGPARLDLSGGGAGLAPPGGQAGASGQTVSAPELDFHFAPAAAAPAGPAAADVPGTEVRMVAADAEGGADIELMDVGGGVSGGAGAGAGSGKDPVRVHAAQVHLDLDALQQPRQAIATGDVRVEQTVAGAERDSRAERLVLGFALPPGLASGATQVEVATETGRVEIDQGASHIQADQMVYRVPLHRAVFTAQPDSAFTQGQVQGQDPDTRFSAPHLVWTSLPNGASTVTGDGGVSVSRDSPPQPGSRAGDPAPPADASAPVVITSQSLRWDQPAKSAPAATAPAAAAVLGAAASFPGTATFQGQVRMAQSPDLLRADRLTLEGARGTLEASGHVTTEFIRSAVTAGASSRSISNSSALALPAPSAPTPVTISASSLWYSQADNLARFADHVVLRTNGAELTAPQLQVWMAPATGPGALGGGPQSALASGGVRIAQPGRTASAAQVRFDFARNLATLLGGPPSIFDAEQGHISGDPLTFSLVSDEIQVGSKSGVRASGQTTIRK